MAGHDLRSAVTMSQMRNMLRGIACDRKEPPGKILARLDAATHILYPHQTLTCIYALVEKQAPDEPWQLHYAVAGHPAPLLVTWDGQTRFLEGGRSMMLGVDPDEHRPDDTEVLPRTRPSCSTRTGSSSAVTNRWTVAWPGCASMRQHWRASPWGPSATNCSTDSRRPVRTTWP